MPEWLRNLLGLPPATELPKYCAECGAELKTEKFKDAYDPMTGEVTRYRVVVRCPSNIGLYDENFCYRREWYEGA
jgi:hypothetical protein